MTIFEKIGIEYEERDGLLYPALSVTDEVIGEKSVGKYGRMWMAFMKENHYGRYRSLMRFGRLKKKAADVNEEAYELLETIEERWLSKHISKAGNSFVEMYKLRTQARMMAEEVVLSRIVRQYH
ncbi:MAG: TnpV protein [Lachnoclostridium sp.]|nr:TnpV protein [Lachnoclostridium sp.]